MDWDAAERLIPDTLRCRVLRVLPALPPYGRDLGVPGVQFGAPTRPAWMLNQIFRFRGRRWIYDADELRHAATEAGFTRFEVCACQRGRDPAVARLDHAIRDDETIYVEPSA
jgi:hypothetical protein